MIKTNSPHAWWLAFRPKTLTGAAAPVILALSAAYGIYGHIDWIPALLCLAFALLMQVDANLVNDYFDCIRGVDTQDRLGPERACSQGWITLSAMRMGIGITTLLACLAGLPLVWWGGWECILVGIACVVFCFLYTTLFSRIAMGDVENALVARYGLSLNDAKVVAQQSGGNWEKAEEQLSVNEEKALYLDLFMQLMRVAYARNIRDMKAWSEQVAALGRERQKRLLDYCQRMIRENFIMNFREDEMVYMSQAERNFSVRFSPFVNERNIFGIMEELSEAQRHIEQNVNAKMVFFDMSLRMIVWIKNR